MPPLATVQASPEAAVGTAPDESRASKHVPLLLRAFRKQVPDAAPKMATQHALYAPQQPLESWAPVVVMHVVHALTAVGQRFAGPIMMHQIVCMQTVSVHGQHHVVARREQTTMAPEG